MSKQGPFLESPFNNNLVVKLGDFGIAKINVKNSITNQQQTWKVGRFVGEL
jgi:hypothetical protein